MRNLQIRLEEIKGEGHRDGSLKEYRYIHMADESGKPIKVGEMVDSGDFKLLKLPGLTDKQLTLCLSLCKWANDADQGYESELDELRDALKNLGATDGN